MPKKFVSNNEYPVVSTPKGLLRGYYYDGVFNFKGIKYANAKRFHMPEEVEPWEGIKDAYKHGPIAMQLPCTRSALLARWSLETLRPAARSPLTPFGIKAPSGTVATRSGSR